MIKIDLVVKGGTVVTPTFTGKLAVGINKGKIISICANEAAPDAERVVDAEGLHVMPGVIDAHVHFRDPGFTYKEDFTTGSMAAAAGGVTSVVTMPNLNPPMSDPSAIAIQTREGVGKSYVDFGILAVVLPTNIELIEALSKSGIVGYKIFMGETVGDLPSPDDWDIIQAFKSIAKTGLRVCVHAENRSITTHLVNEYKKSDRKDALAHLDSRPSISEAENIQRAILFTKAYRTKLHIVHVSSKEGLAIIAQAKKKGLPVTAETCPHYFLLSDEDYKRVGTLIKMNPPVRSKDNGKALLEGLRSGDLDFIATDHSPHTADEKLKHPEDVWQTIAGWPGVESLVPLILTEVNKGSFSMTKCVELLSEHPAKTWNMYPQKGSLQIGSDGDLTIVDLNAEGIIDSKKFRSKAKFTPFDGFKVKGLPIYTIIRGNVVMERGEIVGSHQGRLIKPNLKA